MLDVVVSNIGKHHFYHAVAALVERQFSVKFITRYYTKKKSLFFPLLKILFRLKNLNQDMMIG